MDNKNLILIVSLVVVVFLAGGFVLMQNQKMAGMQEKSGRLILDNPIVEITEGGQTSSYQYSNGSISADCCTEDWQVVRLFAITAAGQVKPCMFTHPRADGIVALTYKNIKLKKTISFTTAIADAVVTGNNASVYMDVYVNNTLLQRITQTDAKGWFATDIKTDQYENKLADVKLVVSSDNVASRWFCWDAQTVE
ncbi:MAG: hypothetical protein AAB361_02480 [Patescibacteria group bacterium]